MKWMMPEDIRVCGENVYAVHSVAYDSLDSYFLGFNAWRGETCLSWDDTLELFDDLGITSVPVIWRGSWEEFYELRHMFDKDARERHCEGYVVRVTREFHMSEFQRVVAKYVRKDHIQTDQHWMARPVVPNGLRSNG